MDGHENSVASSQNSLSTPAFYYDPNAKKPPLRTTRMTKEEAAKGTSGPIRVYSDGIYDLFHFGHVRCLMQAKAVFPNVYLIVGVCNDELTHKMKGLTVMNEEERYTSVLHCRYVDEVVRDAPWVITQEFIDEHRIDFVAHDDIPYGGGGKEDIYAELKEKGMFLATQRTPNTSTSDLITRIVRNYDAYIRRNLFRGYSRQDMNVGYFKEKRIRIGAKISRIHEKIERIEKISSNLVKKWEEKSQELVTDFINLFTQQGRIGSFINESKSMFLSALLVSDEEPEVSKEDV